MSKLDGILKPLVERSLPPDTFLFKDEVRQKQQIKDLMLEIVGEDSALGHPNTIDRKLGWDECSNMLKKELRDKINAL